MSCICLAPEGGAKTRHCLAYLAFVSRLNERNHPAAAKRLWRDSRVLSRLVSRLSRTWQQRFVFLFRSECAPLQHFPVLRV